MKTVLLLGSPVAHSLSPIILNAAFESAGLELRYEAMDVAPEGLAATIAGMRANGVRGANVTIPHKEAVLPLLNEIHDSAVQTSAVNTIVNRDGHLIGHNTDLQGFLHDLRSHWQVARDRRSLILGAGGGARAVAFGLAQEGLDLVLMARSATRAEKVAQEIRREYKVEVKILPWVRESFIRATDQCSLIVNATPLGMASKGSSSPWPDNVPLPSAAFVYDLVYSPSDTPLVQQARRAGLKAVSGAGMLLEQAALSFELWAELRAPRAQMRAALKQALMQSRIGEQSAIEDEVLDA